mgnify:CR=1 FL=1
MRALGGLAWHDGHMTSLLDQLQQDLSAAMKAGNDAEKSTLRMAITAIRNAAVAGDQAVTLTNDQVVAVLQAEAKKRTEAADIYLASECAMCISTNLQKNALILTKTC